MTNWLLIFWLATIGAERIDLFGGKGSFLLTPFLVVSFLVTVQQLIVFISNKNIGGFSVKIPKQIKYLVFLLILFLIVVVSSVLFSEDIILGAKRSGLLIFQIYSAIFIVICLYNNSQAKKILVIGSYTGILISLIMSVLQILEWFSVIPFSNNYLFSIINISCNTYAYFAPRLSGVSIDMNRGGLILVVYIFLILKFNNGYFKYKKIFIYLAILLCLFTFSRSVYLSLLIMGIIFLFQNRRLKASIIVQVLIFAFFMLFILGYLLNENQLFGTTVDFGMLLKERTTFSEDASGGIHLYLIKYAFDIVSQSFKNLIIGIGFGNSYTVLSDVFTGEYGNFHSMFLAILVECGGISLIIFLIMYFYPLFKFKGYLPILSSILFFNIFYQLVLEPMFWFVLVLAWSNFNIYHFNRVEKKNLSKVS